MEFQTIYNAYHFDEHQFRINTFFLDIWYQHDGILNPTYTTEQSRSKITQDIQDYILHCCPIYDYQVYVASGFEVLQNIGMMLKSLESTYCTILDLDGCSDLEKCLLMTDVSLYWILI